MSNECSYLKSSSESTSQGLGDLCSLFSTFGEEGGRKEDKPAEPLLLGSRCARQWGNWVTALAVIQTSQATLEKSLLETSTSESRRGLEQLISKEASGSVVRFGAKHLKLIPSSQPSIPMHLNKHESMKTNKPKLCAHSESIGVLRIYSSSVMMATLCARGEQNSLLSWGVLLAVPAASQQES